MPILIWSWTYLACQKFIYYIYIYIYAHTTITKELLIMLCISLYLFFILFWDVFPKIFGLKGEEVTADWRKLHNEKLDDLYPHQILFWWSNQGKWDGEWASATFRERETYVQGWWEKVKEGDLLEDSGHSWEGDIKMYLKKWDGTGGLNEYGSGYRKVVGYSECSKEPLGATKCWQFLG